MQSIFKKYDIELSPKELQDFEKFLEIFMEKNSQINLSAIRDRDGIIEKHFVDSIMLNIFFDLQWKVADIWTGGGFPLIPLAIINPEIQFTGMDSVWKKIKAIEDFREQLGINNITTVNGRCEDIWQNPNHREQYDIVTSRATAYLPTLIEYAIPLLKVGWVLCAYKLDDKEEIKESKKALARLGAKIMKIKNYEIWDQKRIIIFIEKIAATHKKYPRRVGEPFKNPIK